MLVYGGSLLFTHSKGCQGPYITGVINVPCRWAGGAFEHKEDKPEELSDYGLLSRDGVM